MSVILLDWLVVVASIAVSALLIFQLRSRGMRREQVDLVTCEARLDDIDSRLKLGKLNEAEASAARLALLSQVRSSGWGFGKDLQRGARKFIAPAAVFLLVAGIGTAASYLGNSPEAPSTGDTSSDAQSHDGSDGEMLARLDDYARSI